MAESEPNKQSSMHNQLMMSNKIPKSDKYIPIDVVRKLYDTVDNIRDLFYIMWHIETGVRVSDIVGQVKSKGSERELGQEVNNIDWDSNRVYTYDHKKDLWRYVYFSEKVRVKLKMWLKERQNQGIHDRQILPISEKTCNRILKRWCRVVGFKYAEAVGTHWCRHTFIRLSRKAGRDIKAVQQNTGDTVRTLLEWYANLSSEDMKHELETKPLLGGL